MNLIPVSVRLYRTLLIAYPCDFRREYGPEMTRLFHDTCRDAYRQGGTAAVVLWCLSTLIDLILTALQERRKVTPMFQFKPFLSRNAGVLLMIGGLLTAMSTISEMLPPLPVNNLYIASMLLSVPANLCIGFGLEGVIFRYGTRAQLVGRLALWLAACGMPGIAIGTIAWSLNLPWIFGLLAPIGAAMSAIGLISFAFIDVLRHVTPWSRLIGLPTLLTGLVPFFHTFGFRAFARGVTVIGVSSSDGLGAVVHSLVYDANYFSFGLMAFIGACWIGMGYLIHRDHVHEPSIAAPAAV